MQTIVIIRAAALVGCCALAHAAAVAGPAPNQGAAVAVTVDGAARHQTITGMGAMLYPYAGPYDEPDFPDLFARDTGCSIARMEVIPDALKEEPADLDVFLREPLDLTVKRLDFSVDTINVVGNVIKPIVDRTLDELRLVASVWSPPKWMKTNNSTKNGGSLRADRRAHFAKFLAAYCTGFEAVYGVPVFALSIQNELEFVEPYNSCVYSPYSNDYAEASAEVGRAFKRYGLPIMLFGPEHMCTDGAGGYRYNANSNYLALVLANKDAADAFIAWAFHGYAADGQTVASAAKGWADYAVFARTAGKQLWMSETSGNPPEWLSTQRRKDGSPGRPNGAVTMALNMHDALVYGDLHAWIYWSFQDGSKVSQYNLTARGNRSSKKLAVARHFFRYIRPGAVRINALPTSPKHPVCAFVHDAPKTLTIVLGNQTAQPATMQIALTNIPGAHATTLAGFITSADVTWQPLEVVRSGAGALNVALPAHCVVTLATAPAAQTAAPYLEKSLNDQRK